MTMVRTPQGSLTLKVPHSGIPALRLLQWHAKDLMLELENDKGEPVLVPLGKIDLAHESIAKLNAGRASYVPESTGVHPAAPAAIAR